MATFAKQTFSHAGYAAHRPSYPPSLYKHILEFHTGPRNTLLDLGTGHGLVSRALAPHFKTVIATDPSEGMIATAKTRTSSAEYPNITFRQASAESLPFLADGSVDAVVAGQAAHWFDYPKLWPELRRVLRPQGTVAFWGYMDPTICGYKHAAKILDGHAYGTDKDQIGAYWTRPGRTIVEGKYRAIVPPKEGWSEVERVEYQPSVGGPNKGEGTMFLQKQMKLGELGAYVRTWSAFHGWKEAHPDSPEAGEGDAADKMLQEMIKAEPEWKDLDQEVVLEWGTGLMMVRRD
ncbi:hypothetical protein MRB53_039265 [Persea americana]|nr:hypothetical protein MRB53_039265 [Persea americana]